MAKMKTSAAIAVMFLIVARPNELVHCWISDPLFALKTSSTRQGEMSFVIVIVEYGQVQRPRNLE
jgi:hypothetical protein